VGYDDLGAFLKPNLILILMSSSTTPIINDKTSDKIIHKLNYWPQIMSKLRAWLFLLVIIRLGDVSIAAKLKLSAAKV
jgi:hypothetical protein